MTRWRASEFLRRYRFLLLVYVPALLLATWEIVGSIYEEGKAPNPKLNQINNSYAIEYSKLHRELYPERPRSDYFRGIDELFLKKNPREAKKYFEQALASGVKTDEQLLYYYAVTLVLLKEDPEKIDAAVRNWKINFPSSGSPDPRKIDRRPGKDGYGLARGAL